MNYENSKNENEILSADDEKLREMCRSLKKTGAPPDFDFKLKARIAGAKPDDFQPRFGFATRYALPALALILILGLIAYNAGFLSSTGNPIVAGGTAALPDTAQNSAVSNFSPAEIKVSSNENSAEDLTANREIPKKVEKPLVADNPSKGFRENKKDSFIGSKDFSSTRDKPKQPNFNSTSIPQNAPNLENSNPMPVQEVLSNNGINAVFENGKWIVKSVRANSLGESSGVRENDVIEAIDEQPLSADTVFNNTAGGKTVTVTRKGEKSQIRLRNKQ